MADTTPTATPQSPGGSSKAPSRRLMRYSPEDVEGIKHEVMSATGFKKLEEVDTDALISRTDRFLYEAENMVSAHPMLPYYALLVFVVVLGALLAAAWLIILQEEDPALVEGVYGTTFGQAMFLSLQVVVAAGYEEITSWYLKVVYMLMLFGGIFAFAILVGFLTDGVSTFMSQMNSGATKVSQSGHTLILGWNEATVRVVCQLALLRRGYFQLNAGWSKYVFWWTRLRASSPCAAARVVIMCQEVNKADMERMIANAFAEKGISPKRTRIGTDIICRVGDPTCTHDLVRAAAHRADRILVMLTKGDQLEEEQNDKMVSCGHTIRCLLALRHVLITGQGPGQGLLNEKLRIVVQMVRHNDYVNTAAFPNALGDKIVYPLDLSVFLNSLMFSCADQGGLPQILVELLSFDGQSIRRRTAAELQVSDLTFRQASFAVAGATLIGILSDPKNLDADTEADGLCPAPDRKIKAEDLIIFISESSLPVCRMTKSAAASMEKEYKDQASQLSPAEPDKAGQQEKRNILVCGWRTSWTKQPGRVEHRFQGLAKRLEPGSTVTFLNLAQTEKPFVSASEKAQKDDEDSFEEIMSNNNFKMLKDPETREPYWDFGAKDTGIKIYHVHGDASRKDDLTKILMDKDYDIVIVMGTTFGVPLDAHARDTRVLTILLMMRNIRTQKQRDRGDTLRPMHVISENEEDATSILAIPPTPKVDANAVKAGGGIHSGGADFVNTQAINARALAQTLAYPVISECVQDLIHDSGKVNPLLGMAARFVPLNVNIKFGAVQELVSQRAGHVFGGDFDALCIGHQRAGETLPEYLSADKEQTYGPGDRLVCLVRKKTGSESSQQFHLEHAKTEMVDE